MYLNIKLLIGCLFFSPLICSQSLPDGFVVLTDYIPDLEVELRYATKTNFLGRPVEGYTSEIGVGTLELARQLKKVQLQLKPYGVGLKIYDTYRPQRAVNDFIQWSQHQNDTIMKRKYYPNLIKKNLFALGFIASKSGHSRGSTVDLTLIYNTGEMKGVEVDMGGTWDFFGERSNYSFSELTQNQKENRKLLRSKMIENGFKPYEKEWWHFSLIEEPFPDTYFDFIVFL